MNDESYDYFKGHSTDTNTTKSTYSSEKDEIPVIDETVLSTNTSGEENKYSVNKPRRVKIRARISND